MRVVGPRHGTFESATLSVCDRKVVRFELIDTEIAGAPWVYGVRALDRPRPGLIGWVERLPSGWRRFGYGDNPPIFRSLTEAVDDLIEFDSEEQSTATWPEDKTAF
jgi:hypothetical protein